MKALIAFLGIRPDHLASLRRLLPPLLRVADGDKDEWVQVVSGLVRQKLLPSEEGESTGVGKGTAKSDFVLRKTVREVLERAKQNMSERADNGEGLAGGGRCEGRHMREAPYFGPLEERYVSRKQQPRKQDFVNAHFSVKYDFVSEFSEELASNVGAASNTSSSPTGGGASVAAALASRAGQGGLLKAPGSLVPQPTPAAPNLAQARRVSLAAAVDPSAGSDGLRRTSKPLALTRNYAGLQPGSTRGTLGVGSVRGVRGGTGGGGGGGGGGGNRAGLMMINVDELQAIDTEKQSAREKAKGKPGRKKARVEGVDEETAAGTEHSTEATSSGDLQLLPDGRAPDKASGESKAAEPEAPAGKSSELADGLAPIPQQGEIEAVAAMMVLGVAGGGKDAETSYLPEALAKLLENANSLRPEGKAKLESFFQKKTPEGSSQERVKYHEEVNPGADGAMMRVTSYIRLDYETWVWDRIHKKKRVRS